MAAMVDDVEVVSPGAGPTALVGTTAGAEVELVTAADGSTTPVMSGAPISTGPPTSVLVVEVVNEVEVVAFGSSSWARLGATTTTAMTRTPSATLRAHADDRTGNAIEVPRLAPRTLRCHRIGGQRSRPVTSRSGFTVRGAGFGLG